MHVHITHTLTLPPPTIKAIHAIQKHYLQLPNTFVLEPKISK